MNFVKSVKRIESEVSKNGSNGHFRSKQPAIKNFQAAKKSRQPAKRGTSIRLFLTCWLIFTVHFATNTVREIYPVLSLADRLSFDVSEYAGIHPDIFELEGRGTFINNNPGASLTGAVPYAIFRPLTDKIVERVQQSRAANPQTDNVKFDTIYPMAQEFYQKAREKGFDIKFGLAAAITQAFVMSPISALSVVVMFWVLSALTQNAKLSLWFALLYAFATPVFYRTAQLNQNLLLAHFAFFAFVLLWQPWKPNSSKPFYFLAGICAGWTLVLDYSGLAAIAALSGYCLARWLSFKKNERSLSELFRFASGILICAGILMFYQQVCFGNPFLPAQTYMPIANFTELGYRGFALPQKDLLFETAFSFRYGLFTSAPILLAAFFAPFLTIKIQSFLRNREMIFTVVFTILFFVFCAANQYGRMQFNTGVRHIVPVVPFVFLLTVNVLSKIPKLAATLIGLAGMYWSWCLAMYRDVEQGFGIFEAVKNITLGGFRLPWLTTLEKMGYVQNASVIPIFLLCAAFIWTLWKVYPNPSETKILV